LRRAQAVHQLNALSARLDPALAHDAVMRVGHPADGPRTGCAA
jgi:hypothetical protein